MIWSSRIVFALYAGALTVLLLVPDPVSWFWGVGAEITPPDRGVHFSAFLILAVLCMASRLPWRASKLAVLLVAYALATESLQGLIEGRSVELVDYGENLLGLGVGMGLWTLGRRVVLGRDDERTGPAETSS